MKLRSRNLVKIYGRRRVVQDVSLEVNQGEIVEGASRHLRCSGQIAVEPDADAELGVRVIAPNAIREQIACALANVDAVLSGAHMSRSNVVNLRFYTTDVDAFLANYDVYAEWIAPAGTRPPQSVLGVQRLALPELMIEIEVEAAA